MPSHTTWEGASGARRSDGWALSIVDWRGNRLADAAAKFAVAPYRLDEREGLV